MAAPQEQWESNLQGYKTFCATGSRDVLILVSNVPESPQVVPRKKGELTQQDKNRLTSEGIPPKCWEDDAKLMEERNRKDSDFGQDFSITVEDVTCMKKQYILDRIATLFNNTTAAGVVIHYIGPGRKDTGDWCFTDGFISFEDISNLYTQLFTGKVLTIISDCSYSGHWVEYCKDFLDKAGVQPCGHSAREKGIKLKVRCSCQPDQIASTLLFSARGNANDKNNGTCIFYRNKELAPDQKTHGVDFTEITCKKLPNETCALSPKFTFQHKRNTSRLFLIRGKVDQGRPAWHYILLADDPDTIRMFHEKVDGDINVADYGLVLKSGWGQDPPQDVKDWLDRICNGYEVLQFTH